MSFLFKSKKPTPTNIGLPPSVRKIASRDGTNGVAPNGFSPNASPLEGDRARSGSAGSALAASSMPPRSAPSPVPGSRQPGSRGQMMENPRQGPPRPQGQQQPDPALYPWSNTRLTFSDNENPFPRYGSSTNAVSSKDGEIYMMGGLIDGATVKGDLWIVEAGSQPLRCHQVATSADGPGPRVGHASLMVGNAFIVFGGDTKVDEHDVLDDTLYLLNTATKAWSRVAPSGPRPAGRYGHTLNIIGSKIYIFGGQVDGFFFNDLLAFDLNALQNSTSHWETLVQNSTDGGPPPGQIPPARTNHTVVSYDDKLYLFGGTDGVTWFNDVWTYDPRTNTWSLLECIGFIPAAREGHAAALVDNVMYTFGGRTEEGKDLGDVAGFRISTNRWYTFQNMGPSPSPRSGHGMTAYEDKIIVLGGEPSSAPRNEVELSEAYILDTTKIKYPAETTPARSGVPRRPSVTDRSGTPQQDRAVSRDGSVSSQPGGRSLGMKSSQDSMASNPASYNRPLDAASSGYSNGVMQQRPPRSAPSPAPGQVAPIASQQARMNGMRPGLQSAASQGRDSPQPPSRLDRAMSPDDLSRDTVATVPFAQQRDRAGSYPSAPASYGTSQDDVYAPQQQSTSQKQPQQQPQQPYTNGQQIYHNEQQQYPIEKQMYASDKRQQAPLAQQAPLEASLRRGHETPETGVRSTDDYIQSSFKQPTYADSGVGSSPALSTQQSDGLVKELEAARSKNAWYESELALAKRSGYRSSSLDSPTSPFDDKNANAFGDEEKPLLEALLRMRAELMRVQQSLETQSKSAAERMAQVEKEKEAAVSEALYARTQSSNNASVGPGDARDFARLDDTNRRLASTLNAHNDLKMQIRSLSQSLADERQAREAAEVSAEAAHSRATELDSHKQWSSPEIESLRAQLSEAQRDSRDMSERHAEAYSSSRSLGFEKQELATKLTAAQEAQKNHIGVLTALRAAVQASSEKSGLIERQLEQERQQRSTAEQKLTQLRAEHESRTAELESTSRSLRDTQDLAESHASEARTHREAVLAGIDSTVSRDYDPTEANDERISILQQQVQEANARAQQLREGADGESEKRRRAEERIAGLEAFQEQQNRESLGLRKQLQGAARDHATLQGNHAELQQQVQKHKLDITAWEMHHDSLKNVLGDRGVDTSDFPRDAGDLQSSTNNNRRIQQLEEQVETGNRSQDEMRQMYESREQELRQTRDAEYRALEKECQQMRNGIEKFNTIANTMKKELDKQKDKNRVLRDELEQEKHSRSVSSEGQHQSAAEFENERSKFRQLVDNLQTRLQKSQTEYDSQVRELQSAMSERDQHQQQNQQLQRQLATSRQASGDVENMRLENQELRTRTAAAEKKVQSLLDTVGSSVNNYRRQSQSMPDLPNGPVGHSRGISSNSIGGESNYSTHSTTNGADGNRNSLAQMEAMMNELDSIRGDFERQRQEYSGNRLSTGSVLEGPGPTAGGSALEVGEASGKISSLADMRRRHLSFDEEDDVDEGQVRRLQALS